MWGFTMISNKDALIIEDDRKISEIIKAYLQKDGWRVSSVFDGKEGLQWFNKKKFDLLILDLMLPGTKGEDVCERIRKKSDIPIIFLTSKTREQDKLNGLYMGADDYITKPFSPREFMARVHTVMRRYLNSMKRKDIVSFNDGDIIIDNDESQIILEGRTAELTATEINILNVLANKPNEVFSRNDLMYYVMNSKYTGDGRIIDAHIKNIRKKIEFNPNNPRYIVTVIGRGYKFRALRDD